MAINFSNTIVSLESDVEGRAKVVVPDRGNFQIRIKDLKFSPSSMNSPIGSISIKTNLSDSIHNGVFRSKNIIELVSFGKHQPTCIVSCAQSYKRGSTNHFPKGSKLWLYVSNSSDDKMTTIINFIIYDKYGSRISYGSGIADKGFISIQPATI